MNSSTSAIQSLRKTPLVLQAIFLEILRNFFLKNSTRFQYSSDDRDTGLIIEPSFKMNLVTVQKRPAVYVKRGAYQYNRISIGDVRGKDIPSGTTDYTVLVNTLMTCMCISKNSGETELLADEVSEVLLAFKDPIKRDFGFQRFDVVSINELGILEESREFYACPVLINLQFEESWSVVLDTLKLKSIMVNMSHAITEDACKVVYGKGYYGEGEYGCGSTVTSKPGVSIDEEPSEDFCCPDDPPTSVGL